MLRKTFPSFGSLHCGAERRLIYKDAEKTETKNVPLPDNVVNEIKKASTDESLRATIQEFLRGDTADAPLRVNRDMQLRIYQIDSVDRAKAKELASSIPTDRSGLVRFLLLHEIINAEEYENAIREASEAKSRAASNDVQSIESSAAVPSFNPESYEKKDAKYYDDLVRWKRDEEQKVDQRIQEQWSKMDNGEGLSDLQLRLAELAEKMDVLEKERKSAQQQRLKNRPSQQRGYTVDVRQSMAEDYQEDSAKLRMVAAELAPIYKEYNALNAMLQRNTGEKFASWRLDLSEKGKEELKKMANEHGYSEAKTFEYLEYAKKKPGRFAQNKDYFNDYDFASRIRARDQRDTDLGRQWDREIAEERAKLEEAKRGIAEWNTNRDEYSRKAQRKSADRRTESIMGWNSGEMQRLRSAPTNSEASFNAHLTNARNDGYEVTHSSKGSADIDKTQYGKQAEEEQSGSVEQSTGSSSRRRFTDNPRVNEYIKSQGGKKYMKMQNELKENYADRMDGGVLEKKYESFRGDPKADKVFEALENGRFTWNKDRGRRYGDIAWARSQFEYLDAGLAQQRAMDQLRSDLTGEGSSPDRTPFRRDEVCTPYTMAVNSSDPALQIPVVIPADLDTYGEGRKVLCQPNSVQPFYNPNDVDFLRDAGIWIEKDTLSDGKTRGLKFHFTEEGAFTIGGKVVYAYPDKRRAELSDERASKRKLDNALGMHAWRVPPGVDKAHVVLPNGTSIDMAVPKAKDSGVVDAEEGVTLYRAKDSPDAGFYFFVPGVYVITEMDSANKRNGKTITLSVEPRASPSIPTGPKTPQTAGALPEPETIQTPQPSPIRTSPESGPSQKSDAQDRKEQEIKQPEDISKKYWSEFKTSEQYFSRLEELKNSPLEDLVERTKTISKMTDEEKKKFLELIKDGGKNVAALDKAVTDMQRIAENLKVNEVSSLKNAVKGLEELGKGFTDQMAMSLYEIGIAGKESFLIAVPPYTIRRKMMGSFNYKIRERLEDLEKKNDDPEAAAKLAAEKKAAEEAVKVKAEQEVAERKAKEDADQKAKEAADKLAAEKKAAEGVAKLKLEQEAAAKQRAAEDALKLKANEKEQKESSPEQGRLATLKALAEKTAGSDYTVTTEVSSDYDIIRFSKGGEEVLRIWKDSSKQKISSAYVGPDSISLETLDQKLSLADQIKEVMKLAGLIPTSQEAQLMQNTPDSTPEDVSESLINPLQ